MCAVVEHSFLSKLSTSWCTDKAQGRNGDMKLSLSLTFKEVNVNATSWI